MIRLKEYRVLLTYKSTLMGQIINLKAKTKRSAKKQAIQFFTELFNKDHILVFKPSEVKNIKIL